LVLKKAKSKSERLLAAEFPIRVPSRVEQSDLATILKRAKDERPFQSYLTQHPSFLTRFLPLGSELKVYDRPRFGSQFVPDILLCIRNSQGNHWTGLELESPLLKPLKKNGEMTAALAHAVTQVHDWQRWLRDNVSYARTELGLKGISSDIRSGIVIGRRVTMNQKQLERYEMLKKIGIEVMSYDRLLDK
jgi:hypothetical protein